MIPHFMPSPFKRVQRGFSMLEVMLSVALMAILFMIIAPVSIRLMQKNEMDVARNYTVESMRRAQLQSRSGVNDATWGVKVLTGSVVLFRGASYAARVTSFDETYAVSSSITFSGVTEVIYSKLIGTPSATGTMTLTNTANDTITIAINTAGTLTY